MELIDAHHHLWNPISNKPNLGYVWLNNIGEKKPFGNPTAIQRDYLFEEFINETERFTLLGSVHIQSDEAMKNPILETKWIDQIAKKNNFNMVSVGYVDLSKNNAESIINKHLAYSTFRGVRQIIARIPDNQKLSFVQEEYLDNKTWLKNFGLLEKYNLTFDLQLYPCQMLRAAELIAKHSNTPIVIDHWGSPHEDSLNGFKEWQQGIEIFSTLPNVYLKLSGMGMYYKDWHEDIVKDKFDVITNVFTSNRLMFGSNYPVDKLTAKYNYIIDQISYLAKFLTIVKRRELFTNTANKVYRIFNTDKK